jgi:hypothetical protein
MLERDLHPLADDILTFREWKSRRNNVNRGGGDPSHAALPHARQMTEGTTNMSYTERRGVRSAIKDSEVLSKATAHQLKGRRAYRDGKGAVREAWNRPNFEAIDDRNTHPTTRVPRVPGPSTAFYRSVYEKVDDRGAKRREKLKGCVCRKEQNVVAQQHFSFWGSYKFDSRTGGTLSLEERAFDRYKRPTESAIEVPEYEPEIVAPVVLEEKKPKKKKKKKKPAKKQHLWFKHVKGEWTPAKVMPLFPLRTMILKMYMDKTQADNVDRQEAKKLGKEVSIDELEEYVVEWMQFEYGDKNIVMAKLRDLRKSVLHHARNDGTH